MPLATGSPAILKTIGIVRVAAIAASAPAVLSSAAITETRRLTRSIAKAGKRSILSPRPNGYSIAKSRPSA